MNFRNILFWIHLSCGVSAGVVILIMSVTGVLLTYERQIVAWADRGYHSVPEKGKNRKPLDDIISSARSYDPDSPSSSLSLSSDPAVPVAASLGRDRILYINAYSGEVLGEGTRGIREFFDLMTQWHRWFNITGEGRSTARVITGASNVIFLFLILSGMYLWLPRTFKWTLFKLRLIFSRDNPISKARDFNWHHVFGIWACIPLAIVVSTAFVFSYPAASNMVYRVFGEEPPVRGPRPPARVEVSSLQNTGIAGNQRQLMHDMQEKKHGGKSYLLMDRLFSQARQQVENWNTISLRLPEVPEDSLSFTIDTGDGGQPHKQSRLTLDSRTGDVLEFEPFSSQTPGRQARSLIRRLHTGEALGVPGQTVAGLVSFAGVMLVWTGLALAYRRLIQPLFNKTVKDEG